MTKILAYLFERICVIWMVVNCPIISHVQLGGGGHWNNTTTTKAQLEVLIKFQKQEEMAIDNTE